MNVPNQEKRKEAIFRMQHLGVDEEIIDAFRTNGTVLICSGSNVRALTSSERKELNHFEQDFNSLAYLIIRSFSYGFNMDSILYVSDEAEEWTMDREDIADGYAMTYTVNRDVPEFSEFGSIGVDVVNGMPTRR